MHARNRNRYLIISLSILSICVLLQWDSLFAQRTENREKNVDSDALSFDAQFSTHWNDGHAEIAAYDLITPRYSEPRQGTAVTIFVTEPFSLNRAVKVESSNHSDEDTVSVLKLNLLYDFPTGVYDYHLMTSSFVAVESVKELLAGYPLKVSFSSQEWCGHVWEQLNFSSSKIRHTLLSYFGTEGDQKNLIPSRSPGYSEDTLFHWARGFAAPMIKAGQKKSAHILTSLKKSRFSHKTPEWQAVTYEQKKDTTRIEVPAGSFEVLTRSVRIGQKIAWTFYVETRHPNRIIKWENDEGERAELIASSRMKYWEMNSSGYHSALEKLGLHPRGKRMM